MLFICPFSYGPIINLTTILPVSVVCDSIVRFSFDLAHYIPNSKSKQCFIRNRRGFSLRSKHRSIDSMFSWSSRYRLLTIFLFCFLLTMFWAILVRQDVYKFSPTLFSLGLHTLFWLTTNAYRKHIVMLINHLQRFMFTRNSNKESSTLLSKH